MRLPKDQEGTTRRCEKDSAPVELPAGAALEAQAENKIKVPVGEEPKTYENAALIENKDSSRGQQKADETPNDDPCELVIEDITNDTTQHDADVNMQESPAMEGPLPRDGFDINYGSHEDELSTGGHVDHEDADLNVEDACHENGPDMEFEHHEGSMEEAHDTVPELVNHEADTSMTKKPRISQSISDRMARFSGQSKGSSVSSTSETELSNSNEPVDESYGIQSVRKDREARIDDLQSRVKTRQMNTKRTAKHMEDLIWISQNTVNIKHF